MLYHIEDIKQAPIDQAVPVNFCQVVILVGKVAQQTEKTFMPDSIYPAKSCGISSENQTIFREIEQDNCFIIQQIDNKTA